MMRRSLFGSLAAGLLASLAFATPSQAASVTYYSAVVPQQSDFPFSVDNLTLQQFNPSLGTLTGVTLSVDATVVGYIQVYNSGSQTYSFTNATASVPVTATGPGGATASTVATATLASGTAAPGFNASYPGQTGSSTGTSPPVPLSDFGLYTGTGTFTGTFGSNAMGGTFGGTGGMGSAGKLFFGGTATVGGTIDVTYTYTVAAVPEPNSMALLGIGMAGFFAYRRLFKRPATA